MDGLDIGERVCFSFRIFNFAYFILPVNHVFGCNLGQLAFFEIGKDFFLNDVFFCEPGIQFEFRLYILLVKPREALKTHIHVSLLLLQEIAFPCLRVAFAVETTLTLLLAFSHPVGIPAHNIPCPAIRIFIYRHTSRPLPFDLWRRKISRERTYDLFDLISHGAI